MEAVYGFVSPGGGYLGIDNKHLRVEEHPDGVIRGWGARWRRGGCLYNVY